MKTVLPLSITSIDEAKKFLTDLHNNEESFHPEDDAFAVFGENDMFTDNDCTQLNKLMSDIYDLPGNEHLKNMAFDPCGFLLDLNPEYLIYSILDILLISKEQADKRIEAVETPSLFRLLDFLEPKNEQNSKLYAQIENDRDRIIELIWKNIEAKKQEQF